MGIEMLINAVLKATGFTREKMEHAFNVGKTEFEAMQIRAINAEKALENIQSALIELRAEIKKLAENG